MKAKDKPYRVDALRPLFWEYDGVSVQNHLTSPFVIARVLELANPDQCLLLSSAIVNPLT